MKRIGLHRNTLDKFYTNKDIADLCITWIKEHVEICHKDIIVEPSAGGGVFIDSLLALSEHCYFYDIEPEDSRIEKRDYLSMNITEFSSNRSKRPPYNIHVIGNPPFGRQSSTASQFIKKSCEYADMVAFILPKSFKKESMQKAFPLNFHMIFEHDLPHNSFNIQGTQHNVETVFQIWVKRPGKRELAEKIDPMGFEFVNKESGLAEISIRRVGVNAGKIDRDTEKSVQSHYFIRFTNGKSLDENIEHLVTDLSFEHNNTVGPRSISKQELIIKMNAILGI